MLENEKPEQESCNHPSSEIKTVNNYYIFNMRQHQNNIAAIHNFRILEIKEFPKKTDFHAKKYIEKITSSYKWKVTSTNINRIQNFNLSFIGYYITKRFIS